MSHSDTAMRAALGGIPLNPPSQSEPESTNLPGTFSTTLRLAARRMASFPAVMGVLLSGVAMLGARLNLLDPDTWWHVAVGQKILDTHKFPVADPYSFTALGTHWIAYEWLGEMAMGLAERAGGILGLAYLQIFLVAIVTTLLYAYVYIRSGNYKAACVATAIFLPIASLIFTLRPQLFGYIFLLVTLICLERFRQGHSGALWVLPPLFLIWVNTHGTFIFGFAALAVYFAGGLFNFRLGSLVAEPWSKRQRLQLLSTALISSLAILITPYGSELAAYPLVMATSQPFNISHVQEWQPLTFGLLVGKYLLTLLLVLFVAHVLFPVKYTLQEMALLLFAVYAACVHIRFMLIFVMIIAPVVAMFLSKWIPHYDSHKDRHAMNLGIIALILIAMAELMPSRTDVAKVVATDFPVAAVDYLRQHPQPTGMFNEYGYGGYLIEQLGPQHKVFIDGRADVYEYSGVFQDYTHIVGIENNALALFGKYNIQSVLINRKSGLATLLATSLDWHRAYSDDLSVIFVRSNAAAAAGN